MGLEYCDECEHYIGRDSACTGCGKIVYCECLFVGLPPYYICNEYGFSRCGVCKKRRKV